MQRLELLKNLTFGARVAEEETAELANYFVETDQWNRIFRGEIDIIRGDKGAGKSAIYSLLAAKSNELFDKKILLIKRWSRLSEQSFRVDKWSVCRG
jgi:hypothetical protein